MVDQRFLKNTAFFMISLTKLACLVSLMYWLTGGFSTTTNTNTNLFKQIFADIICGQEDVSNLSHVSKVCAYIPSAIH